ncbi:MAG: transcriptional regulator [Pedosphaera sp.]|nr:transcriptional regulator [Pedosphaera sp.]
MPEVFSLRSNHTEQSFVEVVIGCHWTTCALSAVVDCVQRPGVALERHTEGISAKVLSDRLPRLTRAGIFERVQFPEIPPRVKYRFTGFGKKIPRLGLNQLSNCRRN